MWTQYSVVRLGAPLSYVLSFLPQDYDHYNLEVGYEDGRDRVLLWLPTICKHVITDDSPLASWQKPSGIMADADASIVVVVSYLSLQLRSLRSPICAFADVHQRECLQHAEVLGVGHI